MGRLVVRGILVALALFSGCAPGKSTGQPLASVSGIDELKRQFNTDEGRIRLVLLMSPT